MIDVSDHDGVAVLGMRQGENRLGLPFVLALHDALDDIEARTLPLVVTGDGKFFSNGLDLDWMGGADPTDVARCMDEIHRLLARLLVFPAATAAAINGHAFGAGAMLAAATDFRVMREDRGFLCFPEIDLGLSMSEQFSGLLRGKYTTPTLHEAWITGARFGGADATRVGLVHATASADTVVETAAGLVRPLALKDGATMQALKQALYPDALGALTSKGSP